MFPHSVYFRYILYYVILYRYAMDSQTDQLQDRDLVAQLAVYCIRIAEISLSSEFWSFYFVAMQELKKKKIYDEAEKLL